MIRLPAIRVGGRWLVLRSKLDEFFNALGTLPAERPLVRTPTARAGASNAAAAKLEALGA
jgi:hypothetical protein